MKQMFKSQKFLLLVCCMFAFTNVYSSGKLFILQTRLAIQPEPAKIFYIDSQNGIDSNNGLSPKKAWRSLSKVNSVILSPGSKLLFKAGGIWNGQLRPLGSGIEGMPIIIDKYGKGPKPILNGQGIIASGVIKLNNQSYWEIKNLEIINTASFDAERKGIEVNGSNFGLIKHIYLQNLSIHDIRGTVGNELSDKKSAGIYFTVADDRTISTRYDNILIEGCEIYNCQNQGIVINNEVKVSDDPGSEAWEKRKITNLVVRDNIIHHISKNAMIIRLADKGLIERNLCYETALGTTGNTIFSRSARNTVFQYNEGYLNRSPDYDGSMYDPDLKSPGTIWQYSYSHDNAHGLVWFCTDPRDTGIIVRYNISYNDKGNLVYINYGFKEAQILNNTFYVGKGLKPKIIVENPKNDHTYFYQNNIVFNADEEDVKFDFATNGQGAQNRTISHNIFFRTSWPPHINLINNSGADPLLIIPGIRNSHNYKVTDYKLAQGSPALYSGISNFNIIGGKSQKPNIGYYSGHAVYNTKRNYLGPTPLDSLDNIVTGRNNDAGKREINRETLRYRSVIYNKHQDKNPDARFAEEKLRDTVLFVLKKLKLQEQLLSRKSLWPYSRYRDFLADLNATNQKRRASQKKGEVLFGPIEFTERSFYDYQFSNAVNSLKKMMEGNEIPVNDVLLNKHFNKQKQTVYAAEKHTFENMKRQVKEAYVEEQYGLLIDKLLIFRMCKSGLTP